MMRVQNRRQFIVMFGVVAFALAFVLSGCDKTVAPTLDNPYDSESASYVAFPELTTRVVTQVSSTQAESGGSFGTDYGSEVSVKGVCWAEQGAVSGLPVVGGDCTDEGGGFDSFASVMTGLEPGVSYVVRSYAMNADGTVYGGEREFVTVAVYRLSVAVDGDGSVMPESGEYEDGTEVELTATSDFGWVFARWDGDVAGGLSTVNPLTLTMDGNKIVTAVFERLGYDLDIVLDGYGTVTESIITQPSTEYCYETVIELLAQPLDGWRFVEWMGDVAGGGSTTNPLMLTMDGDKSVTAIFEISRNTDTEVVNVTSPLTGVTWMDRNLGASHVAMAYNDAQSYGDLYQWGRAGDGYEKRYSGTSGSQSDRDQPLYDEFIIGFSDWRSPRNDDLWQGVDGRNNPCPEGYRVPTASEWQSEYQSWSDNNRIGAYESPLKLSSAGYRSYSNGSISNDGSVGYYWSSTVDGSRSSYLYFSILQSDIRSSGRASGYSVRCMYEIADNEVTLLLQADGNGTVTPESGVYIAGTVIELLAQPLDGWRFVEWMGDVAGGGSTTNPLMLTMDSDKSVTAVFEQDLNGRDTETEVVDVVNPATGVTWMDRNLGASRAATGSTDSEAYGDLYQWGRAADGHEKRTSGITSTLSTTDQPGHGDFITKSSSPYDWRSPQNDNLWQGVVGVNNPCPVGYRLPTEAEWNAERSSWSSNNGAGAYASPLKLPVAGLRNRDDGSLSGVGSRGDYWSSSVDGASARSLYFGSSNTSMLSYYRAYGLSVRCRKE